jgi:hypothetical protein
MYFKTVQEISTSDSVTNSDISQVCCATEYMPKLKIFLTEMPLIIKMQWTTLMPRIRKVPCLIYSHADVSWFTSVSLYRQTPEHDHNVLHSNLFYILQKLVIHTIYTTDKELLRQYQMKENEKEGKG